MVSCHPLPSGVAPTETLDVLGPKLTPGGGGCVPCAPSPMDDHGVPPPQNDRHGRGHPYPAARDLPTPVYNPREPAPWSELARDAYFIIIIFIAGLPQFYSTQPSCDAQRPKV